MFYCYCVWQQFHTTLWKIIKGIKTMASNNRNPELEALRQTFEGPPNLEAITAELIKKTSRIHAAFLFDKSGLKVLQLLCRCLSSTQITNYLSGWEDLGIHLGLDDLVIRCISLNNFQGQDPTYNTLLAYVQQKEPTLDKIIRALVKMGRMDIINRSCAMILSLADDVLSCQMNEGESGFCSGYEVSRSENITGPPSYGDFNEVKSNIIRPLCIPPAPFIFKDINLLSRKYSFSSPHSGATTEQESFQKSRNDHSDKQTKSKIKYGRKVMLTFGNDGLQVAQQVADIFRRKRENQPRIGVVILNDHSDLVHGNPEQFISACFHQVDYIVPIITEGYLKAIASTSNAIQSSSTSIDANYVKFIHSLMSTYYLRNGCINDKIRCIIPDNQLRLSQTHPLMMSPLFQAWVKASETEQLSYRILRARFQID